MRRQATAYFIILAIFLLCVFSILQIGSRLPGRAAKIPVETTPTLQIQNPGPAVGSKAESPPQNLQDPIRTLLWQLIVIITTAGLIGLIFSKIGQPAVMGEMVAGILLGPSVLGILFPGAESFLFPSSSLQALNLLSQIGIILFMFVVGINLDLGILRNQARSTVIISHTSILLPFLLGTGFSMLLYRSDMGPSVSFNAFALFIGISMSITAFPVLARIVEDRGLSKTSIGTTALACAAIDDATAWCLLAFVLAVIRGDELGRVLFTLLLTFMYTGVMILLIRPAVGRLLSMKTWDGGRDKWPLAGVLAFVLTSALLTEWIGIHALFGAFLAGVAIPSHPSLRVFLRDRLEAFGSAFLLPIFFVFTGLRTQIGLLLGWQDWLLCAAVIAIAVVGKLAGSLFAARWSGMSWLDSAMIGTLMNSRGLVELIALNLGYDLGILSPRIFTMLVLMALTTTFMTGPILSLIENLKRRSGFSASWTSDS